MPVDDAEALRKSDNEGFEAAERVIHSRAIKEASGSICWGLSVLAIGGGLWLLCYRGRLPEGHISSFIALMGVALVLGLHGFLSLRAHRTGTERAHRRLTTFTLIIHGIVVLIGAVLAAMLISMSIVMPLGIDDRFLYVIVAFVLVAIWGVVTMSYFWRRARTPTGPAPTFFGHVCWSVGIAFSGSLAVSQALLFGFASIVFVRQMDDGAPAKILAVLAIMPVLAICLFAFAILMLWGSFKHYRNDA
jgi:hypothetical protein